jgi:hypothetical protein
VHRVARLKPGNEMPTSLEQIRKHPQLYLGDVEPNGMLLAARFAESALVAGPTVNLNRLTKQRGGK